MDFLTFNIQKIPNYIINYDENFWYNKNLLIKILTKVINTYEKCFVKFEINCN